jgi:hypothetical protein
MSNSVRVSGRIENSPPLPAAGKEEIDAKSLQGTNEF